MRLDVFFVHHPGQHRTRSVSGIADEPIGLDVKLFLDPLDHGIGALEVGGSMRRGRLPIHDHAMLDINQIVRRVGEKGRASWRCGPTRKQISQLQALRHGLA